VSDLADDLLADGMDEGQVYDEVFGRVSRMEELTDEVWSLAEKTVSEAMDRHAMRAGHAVPTSPE
jgi:hypothetical protein